MTAPDAPASGNSGFALNARTEWREHWPTVLAGTIGLSLTTVYVYSSGVLMVPIQRDLGWSRTEIISGLTVATTCAAIVGPFVGAAVDKFGPRRLAMPGVVLFSCCLALLSTASSPRSWWLLWALAGIASAGVKPTIWATAVSSLFSHARGLALAVTLSGAGIGSALVPLLTQQLIDAVGWRMTYVLLALIWGGVTFLLVIFLFRAARDKPRVVAAARLANPLAASSAWRAIASRPYLFILIASTVCALIQMGMTISLVPLLADQGIAPTAAAGLAATLGVTSVGGRLGSGYLMDRMNPRIISTISVAMPSFACMALLAGGRSWTAAFVAVALLGLSIGAELEAATFLTSRYFDLRHFGLLFGIITSALTVATGMGPLAASYIYDSTGSYDLLLIGIIPLGLAASVLIALLGPAPPLSANP